MNDSIIKIIILGDSDTGKTALFDRYTESRHRDGYNLTIGIDFKYKQKVFNVDNRDIICKMHIWDTAGHEKFKSLTRNYYRGTNICLICVDINKSLIEMIESVNRWIKELDNSIGKISSYSICVIGTKVDLKQDFRHNTNDILYLSAYLENKNIKFYVCSSKHDYCTLNELTEINIDSMFDMIVKDYLLSVYHHINTSDTSNIKLKNTNNTDCCTIL